MQCPTNQDSWGGGEDRDTLVRGSRGLCAEVRCRVFDQYGVADVTDLGGTTVGATVDRFGGAVGAEDASTVSAVVLRTERQHITLFFFQLHFIHPT